MNLPFLTGLLGSLILVTGAAWPNPGRKMHPTKSIKNWLFTVGGLVMLLYSILGYQAGGPLFFVILEILAALSTLLMMLNTPDKIDVPLIGMGSLGLIAWSLFLFEGYTTLIFITGLCGVGLGYAFQMGTLRRDLALTFGSTLIAVFSFIEASWIFFGLNGFFAIFSAYYTYKALLKK